jgi:hydrogenase-4 membrane subunit HyfE
MITARPFEIRKLAVVLVHALVVQALCWMTMGVGRAVTSMENTLIIHLIGAPIFAIVVSAIYFKKFNYTTPLQTAIVFILVIVSLDFFVVALMIEKSFEMFASPIGTWIPFTLIFTSTYLTGLYATKRAETTTVA